MAENVCYECGHRCLEYESVKCGPCAMAVDRRRHREIMMVEYAAVGATGFLLGWFALFCLMMMDKQHPPEAPGIHCDDDKEAPNG